MRNCAEAHVNLASKLKQVGRFMGAQMHLRQPEVCNEGDCTWLERWLRPSCWMALSADQGSSQVRWTRRRWLAASALACRDIPVLAASDTIATTLSPFMNAAAAKDMPIVSVAMLYYF